jgi:hypothetical protein
MIGVKMMPTGNQDKQLKSNLEKAKTEARYITEGNISEVETQHGFRN